MLASIDPEIMIINPTVRQLQQQKRSKPPNSPHSPPDGIYFTICASDAHSTVIDLYKNGIKITIENDSPVDAGINVGTKSSRSTSSNMITGFRSPHPRNSLAMTKVTSDREERLILQNIDSATTCDHQMDVLAGKDDKNMSPTCIQIPVSTGLFSSQELGDAVYSSSGDRAHNLSKNQRRGISHIAFSLNETTAQIWNTLIALMEEQNKFNLMMRHTVLPSVLFTFPEKK